MSVVLLHSPRGGGRRWENKERTSTSPFRDGAVLRKILMVLGLSAIFFALAYFLPINAAAAAEASLRPMDYEIRDPIVLDNRGFSPFVAPPPQWQRIEDMPKSEQRAYLAYVAATAVSEAIYNPLGKAMLAIREPIRSSDGNISCKTKLSLKTYYMKCGFKF